MLAITKLTGLGVVILGNRTDRAVLCCMPRISKTTQLLLIKF